MMTTMKDIAQFFREERLYGVLFGVILALGAYLWFFPPGPADREKPETSPAVEAFRQKEEALEQRMKTAGSLEELLKTKPLLRFLFQALSFLAAGAFSAGIVLDGFLIFSPAWRRNLSSGLSPPEVTPWKFSMLFKVILLFITASLALNFILGFIHQFVVPFSLNFYMLFHSTLVDILCILFVVYVIRQAGGHWKDLGLRIPPGGFWREVTAGLAGYVAILPIFVVVLLFLVMVAQFFTYEPPPHPLVGVFLEEEKRSPALIAYSIFLACFVGPLTEEIFFRGFCYPIFKKKWGIASALILSAAFFSFIHHNQFAFWPIFILGVALAYFYEKRRSLIACMTLHMTHNMIFIAYFFLAKQIVQMGSGGGAP